MKNKTRTAKKLLALVLSLMMIVTAVPMMSFTSAAAEDLSTLATAINNYETKVAQGGSTYWTGLTNAFDAYNNAKRYYDAVKYGGYDGTAAGTYATALNNAVNAMGTETEFKDYCNITVYANSQKSEQVTGATNLIYYGADSRIGFDKAWAANADAYKWGELYFRFDIPNFVLGLDGTTTAKAPFQIYYFKTDSGTTQYLTSVSCTDNYFTIPQFTISNTYFSTTIGTDALNKSGNWALNNPASGMYFAGNTGSTGANGTTWISNATYQVHQASSYLTTSNSTIGLTASNNSAQLSYTIAARRSNFTSPVSYSSLSTTTTSNDRGYAYVVYMTDYNANYQNWKSIIPNLSYKNYSGYPFANAYTAAQKLDTATTISLAQNNFAEHGDMSGAVNDWADRIQSAATYQSEAKTAAGSTTISSYYNDLIGEIPTSDTVYAAGQKCYTDDSWNTFVTAYNAAKTHMSDLSPKGTNSQYSDNNSTVGTLYLNLQAARLGLKLKAVTEDGHTWTETARTAATCEADGSVSYKCDVCAQTKTETLTALGHKYTGAVHSLDNGTHNWACTNSCGTYGTLTGGKDATVDCSMSYANISGTQHTGTCSVCGYNVTENHTWSTTGTTTDPTCDTAGQTVYPCTKCTGTKTETIPATGAHTWTNTTMYVKTAATCGADAVYYKECSVCHKSSETLTGETWTDTGSATGAHTWNDGEVTEAATCTEDGVKTFTCTVCGETKTEAISATGHTEVSADNAVAATCTTPGKESDTVCSVCGETLEVGAVIPATGHTEVSADNAVAATCTTDGKESDTVCSVCGVTITRGATIDALGHDFTEKVIDADHLKTAATCKAYAVYYYDCSRCDVMATDSDTNPTFEDVDAGYAAHKFDAQSTDAEYLASAATCTAKATYYYSCSVCGEKGTETFESGELAAHNYVWVTDTDATCGKGGTKHEECSVCGYKNGVTDTIPATGAHNYTDVVTDPTCTADGYTTHTCSVCGDVKVDTYVDKLGHDIVNHDAKAPTCTEIGWDAYETCSRCDYTTYEEKAVLGHDIVNHDAKAPTCTEIGWDAYDTCSRCDYTTYVEKAALGHDIVSHDAKAPTCTEIGWDAYDTCSRCDYTTYVEKVALGHDIVNHDAKAPTCTEIGWDAYETCSRCDYTTYEEKAVLGHDIVNHDAKAPTCTEIGWDAYETCSRCDYTTYEEKAALGHDIVNHDAKAPTCTEIGWDAYDTCSRCDYTTYVEKAALGHDIVNHDAKAPTCTEIGWDAYDTCSRCDYTTYVEKAALGHDLVSHEAKAPTCTEIGWDAYDTCSRCDYTTYVELPATGHTPATREENRVEASCGTDGSYDLVTYCTVCNEVLSTEHKTIPATGEHNYVTEVEGTRSPATCVAEGSVTMSCGCGATKDVTLAIDPTNHANVVTDAAVAATCETTGLTEGSHCESCKTVIVAQTVTDKLGHAWGEWTVVDAATCTKKGSEKRVCANDASHVETREIDMIAHTEEILPAKEATCTETGLTEGKKCSVCGTILVAQTEVAMKDHTPAAAVQENVVPATCTTKGSYDSVVYCSVCNAELSRTTVDTDMIDHTPSDWIIDGDASCATGGTKHKECTVCHTVLATETIPATGVHSYVDVVTAPTCVAQGYTTHTCSVCGDSYVDSYVDALGHTEVADEAVAATCETAGKTAGSHCSVCGEILVAQTEIPALGHDYGDGVLTRPAFADGTWVDGYYTYTCNRDAAHTYTETAPRADYTEYDKLVSDINNAIASGSLTQDAIDALNEALANNAIADNLIDSEQATVDSAASALKDALDAAAGALKPDFTEIDKALDEYDDADAAVVVPDDVANRIDEIKNIINEIKNDPNATRADKQDDIDALVDEVNGYVSHLAECAKGNHEFSAEWTIDIEATCAHSGWKSHHCAYCGATTARPEYDADGVEIPKLAHSVSSWTETKAPTCTAEGEKTGTCDVCGETVTEAIAKLGHNWSAWTRTKNSTCIEKGTETRTCDRCGETQTRELPLVGHHIVTLPGVDATCDEPGKTDGQYCDVCGLVTKEQKEIPARGHLDMDGDGKCDACDCDYDGECECICHNDSIFSKIVRFIYTLFSKIFHKRITCCQDMEFWGGEIKDLT